MVDVSGRADQCPGDGEGSDRSKDVPDKQNSEIEALGCNSLVQHRGDLAVYSTLTEKLEDPEKIPIKK